MKRIIAVMLAVLFTACCLVSCNAKYSGATDNSMGITNVENTSTSVENSVTSERKLIKNAELNIETKQYDDFIKFLNESISEAGGYIESSSMSDRTDSLYERSATIVARIPADKLDEFIDSVGDVATIVYNRTGIEDITAEYIDVESRISALEAEQASLKEMMKSAANVSELLEIQQRLSQVNGDLESYKSQLKVFSEQVALSTVTMYIDEVDREATGEKQGFWSEVGTRLFDNIYDIGQGLRAFAIFFISSLPYFAVIGVLAAVVIIIIRICIKSSRKKK